MSKSRKKTRSQTASYASPPLGGGLRRRRLRLAPYAILAALIRWGIRREDLWVIAGILGKAGHIRTVP